MRVWLLVECLPSFCKDLGLIPRWWEDLVGKGMDYTHFELGVVAHTCNPSSQEAEAEGFGG
jgi:hypothetical protein